MADSASIVFVVDDDPSVRRAIKRLIESVGLAVELFGSAKEFLSSPHPEVPSCIILDVRLPGMSGLDLQRTLAATGAHIPIVFITSHGDIPMTVRAMKAGAIEFLPKPFRDQDLLDSVQRALEQDRARRQRKAEFVTLWERFESLTPRERQVLPLVVSGLLNKHQLTRRHLRTSSSLHSCELDHRAQARPLAISAGSGPRHTLQVLIPGRP
jgi:FixJ family two-component response regulator